MSAIDIFIAQMTDPFRIGLIVVMSLTSMRTAANVGLLIPLTLGVIFVAVLIPTAMGQNGGLTANIAIGLVANTVLLGIAWSLKAVYLSLAKKPEQKE